MGIAPGLRTFFLRNERNKTILEKKELDPKGWASFQRNDRPYTEGT